jgi:hypothetical protein
MKQTAVDWLVEQICGDHTSEWQEQIDQAKAMEKEQIHAEYMRGWKDGLTSSSGVTYRCCGLRLSIHGCGCPQETLKSE